MGCLIIAEAGVNHNGDLGMGKELVHAAKEAGADVVKFQTYRVKDMTHGDKEMLAKYQLTPEMHWKIKEECQRCGIAFASTPFGIESVHFLSMFDMPFWKVPSGEMTNEPYLKAIADYGGRVIMSTGMASEEEILSALGHFDYSDVTLLHCTTQYPAELENVNLLAMVSMRENFGKVGYSDHTIGLAVPLAAVALGAVVIEKHITLDCAAPGPDHRASMEPGAFAMMVRCVRDVEQAMGDGIKRPTAYELGVRESIRNRFV